MKTLYIIGIVVAVVVAIVYMIVRVINKTFKDFDEKD